MRGIGILLMLAGLGALTGCSGMGSAGPATGSLFAEGAEYRLDKAEEPSRVSGSISVGAGVTDSRDLRRLELAAR